MIHTNILHIVRSSPIANGSVLKASKMDGDDEQGTSRVVQIDQESIQSLLTHAMKDLSVRLTETIEDRLQTFKRQIMEDSSSSLE